jgi:outer membrane protein TolC
MCWLMTASQCAAADKADNKDHMRALLKERVETAKAIYDELLDKFNRGAGNIGSVHRAKTAWLNAQLDLADTKKERVKIYEEIYKEAKEWEQTALRNIENGAGERIEALTARAERIDAEIALEQARAEPEREKIPAPKP